MKILVFQHTVTEHAGNFRDVMAAQGHHMQVVELDEGEPIPALAEYDALLVMGGPMNVWETDEYPWLLDEMDAIRSWVRAGRPYLGLCLGHQLLGQALGGSVGKMQAAPEVGMFEMALAPDPLFAGLPNPCPCFQWHGAEVATLPPGARALASSPACRVQAMAIGPAAYGLQFHMELTATTAQEWGAMPYYAAALERLRGPNSLPGLQAEVAAGLIPLQDAAHRLFSNFLAIAQRARHDRTARLPATVTANM